MRKPDSDCPEVGGPQRGLDLRRGRRRRRPQTSRSGTWALRLPLAALWMLRAACGPALPIPEGAHEKVEGVLLGRTVASSKVGSGAGQNGSGSTADLMKYLQSMGLSEPIENRTNGLNTGDCEMRRREKGTQSKFVRGIGVLLREGMRWPFMLVRWTEEGDEPLPSSRSAKMASSVSKPEGRGRSAADAVTIPATFQAR
jgi:hypothetical protein